MPALHVVLAAVREFDQKRMALGRALQAMVIENPARIRSRLPAVHSRRECREYVHAVAARLVPSDRLETLASEQLARPRNVFDARKPIVIPGPRFPAVLAMIRAGDAESGVLGELAEKVFDVIRVERNVRVEITDDPVGKVPYAREAGVEGVHLPGKSALCSFR